MRSGLTETDLPCRQILERLMTRGLMTRGQMTRGQMARGLMTRGVVPKGAVCLRALILQALILQALILRPLTPRPRTSETPVMAEEMGSMAEKAQRQSPHGGTKPLRYLPCLIDRRYPPLNTSCRLLNET